MTRRFCFAKGKNVATAKAAPYGAGGVWTWTAIDANNKMILSYEVGDCSAVTAHEVMVDLPGHLGNRGQLTTDGRKPYLSAVESAFGIDLDYAMLVRLYGETSGSKGHEKTYSPAECTDIRKEVIMGSL